eukprot:2498417-Heterocapsa_arctica.AAC.1
MDQAVFATEDAGNGKARRLPIKATGPSTSPNFPHGSTSASAEQEASPPWNLHGSSAREKWPAGSWG